VSDGQLIAVQILWDLLLAIVIFVVVPLVLYRAARLVRASRNIAVLFNTSLASAVGVIENTQPTRPALDQTIAVATDILGTAAKIDEHSAAIEGLLTQRAAQGRSI
jgi:hypothetical protein